MIAAKVNRRRIIFEVMSSKNIKVPPHFTNKLGMSFVPLK